VLVLKKQLLVKTCSKISKFMKLFNKVVTRKFTHRGTPHISPKTTTPIICFSSYPLSFKSFLHTWIIVFCFLPYEDLLRTLTFFYCLFFVVLKLKKKNNEIENLLNHIKTQHKKAKKKIFFIKKAKLKWIIYNTAINNENELRKFCFGRQFLFRSFASISGFSSCYKNGLFYMVYQHVEFLFSGKILPNCSDKRKSIKIHLVSYNHGKLIILIKFCFC
jgi:hypothetical protein